MKKKRYDAPLLTVEEFSDADIVMISVSIDDDAPELPSISWGNIN